MVTLNLVIPCFNEAEVLPKTIEHTEGDVLISLDADLQDDLDAIPRIPAEYRAGTAIVDGVRSNRDGDTFFKRATAHAYYRLLRIFGAHIVSDHAGSHLMGCPGVDALSPSSPFSGIYLFLRGVIPPLDLRTIRVGRSS